MRILLIDDSDHFRVKVRQLLRESLPEAAVDSWDPVAYGKPGDDFDWRRYDVLLIDESPAPGADALDWLQDFRRNPGVPPTVVLATTSGEEMAVRAGRAGASDLVPRERLDPERLGIAIKEALLDGVDARRSLESPAVTQPLPIMQIGRPASPQGIQIDGYRILREIGRGGMSQVFLAERDGDAFTLVLKVLDARLHNEPQARERFLREYRIMQRIRDEHVVAIYDQGVTDRHAYIAMEYFPGGDLKHRIRTGISSIAALRMLMQLAKALHSIHLAGVVHRDLKPQNVMFRESGRLALLDFGLARELDATSTLTQRGVVFATPLYMSPEQCIGEEHGPRGDLYSAGAMFYEMLTGEPPFAGDNAPSLAYQHVHADVPRLPNHLAGYQPIIDRLLAKDPADRFQSASDLFAYIAH